MFLNPPNPDALLDELFGPAPQPTSTDVAEWIERHFYIPETPDHRIRLMPYQKAVLREASRKDANGNYIYAVVLWSDIKKSGKSTIAGAMGLYRAAMAEWGSIKVIANDLKQADSRVSYYMRRSLELNKAWASRNVEKVTPSGYTIDFRNHTRIEAIPVDPKGEAGGNDDLLIFSELWAASGTAALRMWTEMTLSPTKFGKSQRWVETYAGFSGESPLLEGLYEAGHEEGRQLDLSYTDADGTFYDLRDLEVYANPTGKLLCLWNTRPRCPWQTDEYYATEAATLIDSEFQRVHRNRMASSKSPFLPIEWFDACKVDELPPIKAGQPAVVSLDAAVSGDNFAISVHTRDGDLVELRYARTWTPPKGGKITYSNPLNPADMDTPEGVCRWILTQFNVICWTYDEYQLHDFCTRLRNQGLGWFFAFPQGEMRLVADKAYYDRIVERRYHWSLDTPGAKDVRQHIENADRVPEKDKLRIVKRVDHGKPIDLAVAASMGSYKLMQLNLG